MPQAPPYAPTVEVELRVSPAQRRLLASTSETVCLQGGAGSGKTRGGVTWALLNKAIGLPGSRGMIVSPTFPMLKQSVLVHLRTVAQQLGLIDAYGRERWKFHKQDMQITLPNGSSFLLRSADTPERLLGADLAWVYGDEVALWQHNAFRYCEGRLRQEGFRAQSLYTFTPKGLNWAAKVFGEPRPGLEVIRAATADNPWAQAEFLERLQREYGGDTRFFRQEVLGEFVAYEGLVYPHFGPALLTETLDGFDFVEYACGVDWGWSNPGAIILIGRTSEDQFVVIREVYASGMGLDWWGQQAAAITAEFGSLPFFCDPSDPKAIEYLRSSAGVDARKAPNEVVPGIALVGGRLANKSLLVHASCTHLIEELLRYSWKSKSDGSILADQPDKTNDHACDALRYDVMGLSTRRRFWWQDENAAKELYGT